ncbi:MAG TPA: hypothetical protein VFE47_10055 [Tepidisphaeraceae bacterium]|jgi:Tfp pilus assembly protein PilV|nr:hypothetical protein [Tepidisphaeraceae bacterium]
MSLASVASGRLADGLKSRSGSRESARVAGGSMRRGRPAFSFTEVLFAVMILGIGFIMVAAMFPVAIKQTQETVEETTAAGVAKGAASYMARVGTNSNFPSTLGKVVGYAGPAPNATAIPFWQALSGNLILSTDSRYAWVPFYSRTQTANTTNNTVTLSPYAQVTIICVSARNSANFTNADLKLQALANLQGRPALAVFNDGSASNVPDTITLSQDTANGGPANPGAGMAEGAYIIVADDSNLPNVQANPLASSNGNVYRIGIASNGSTTTWELLPGSDMRNARYVVVNGNPTPARPVGAAVHVYLVGRGYGNSNGGDTGVAGPAMDVAAYSTFIQVRPDPSSH